MGFFILKFNIGARNFIKKNTSTKKQETMKKATYKIIYLLMILLLNSCVWRNVDDDINTSLIEPPQYYEAQTMLRTEFENSTQLLPAQPISKTGKIYIKDGFLFINQPNKGFHIFDNSNPSAPINMAFLEVLGSSDLSIKNDILYINNATDLIAIKPNFNNNTIDITKRIINTFPELTSPNNCCHSNTPDNEVIINWTLIE